MEWGDENLEGGEVAYKRTNKKKIEVNAGMMKKTS